MYQLVANVNNEYKNVLAQKDNFLDNIYLNSVDAVEYNSAYKLDEDQWFKIKEFSKKGYFINVCLDTFSTSSLSQITSDEYTKISSICILNGKECYFQRITSSLYVNKRTLLDYSGEPKIVLQRKQIEIRSESDAIYSNNLDTLFFKNISKIKPIFPGIEILHREATQKEVDAFLSLDFIKLSKYNTDSVGLHNRKRIADIGQKFNNLTKIKQGELIKYAKENANITYEEGAFIIDSDNNLKNLLYAFDQRYYFADIYEEKRIANSVLIIKNNE